MRNYNPEAPSKKEVRQAHAFSKAMFEPAMRLTMADDRMMQLHFDFDTAVNTKIKTIDGWQWDGENKRWLVPVARLQRTLDVFPTAAVGADVQDSSQADEQRRHGVFFDNLVRLGVTVDSGGVGHGAGMSPVLQQEIDKRAK